MARYMTYECDPLHATPAHDCQWCGCDLDTLTQCEYCGTMTSDLWKYADPDEPGSKAMICRSCLDKAREYDQHGDHEYEYEYDDDSPEADTRTPEERANSCMFCDAIDPDLQVYVDPDDVDRPKKLCRRCLAAAEEYDRHGDVRPDDLPDNGADK